MWLMANTVSMGVEYGALKGWFISKGAVGVRRAKGWFISKGTVEVWRAKAAPSMQVYTVDLAGK